MDTKIAKLSCLLIFLCSVLSFSLSSGGTEADLVFLGTVVSVEASPLDKSKLNWIVRCRVDRILSGDFSGKTLSFRVHSPAKSGIEIGEQYKIKAKRSSNGYTVDQYQFMK